MDGEVWEEIKAGIAADMMVGRKFV